MITLVRKRNKRYYPVDAVFNIGRGAYQVREADGRYYTKFDSSGIPEYGCQSCCFRMSRNNGACALLACRASERSDGREVVFQKI